jgi:hypothetical protein
MAKESVWDLFQKGLKMGSTKRKDVEQTTANLRTEQKAYERCSNCARFFENLEKHGVICERECDFNLQCHRSGPCSEFLEEKESLQGTELVSTLRGIGLNVIVFQ